ncbi:MAG: hypothetical protein AAF700_04535 [Pseudomonadota bacterium]
MKHRIYLSAALFCVAMAGTAEAACFADYKAKKDDPLQLHYGVIELPASACGSASSAASAIAPRLAKAGWTLLNVLSVFDESGLAERKDSAGRHYLRY